MAEIKQAQLNHLFSLLGALRDDSITEHEFAELNRMLNTYPDAREYYLDYIELCNNLNDLHASLQQHGRLSGNAENSEEDYPDLLRAPLTIDTLQMLAEYEKTAEALEVPQQTESQKPDNVARKVPVHVPPHRISKFSLISLAASIAALLLLMTYITLNPRTTFEVATLTGAVDAKWSYDVSPEKGARLTASSSEPIQLQKGVIEIRSDKGVLVTLEGPAEFRFTSADEITMNYGRLFANVPQSGSGFSVQTLNTKTIDLGTEFGVFADLRGKTELHVFKGKTILIVPQSKQGKKTMEVNDGGACRIDAYNNVTNISPNRDMFARGIDSDAGIVLTGGRKIDLADIIGSGDGSGNGTSNKGLLWDGTSPVSTTDFLSPIDVFPASYVPVVCNPLIDGIFVPYAKGEVPTALTSEKETLNLDDFIASDTNGLITLVLLREFSDESSTCWFSSKETTTGNPEEYPTLVFPHASTQSPVHVTTAHINGADAYVSNDELRLPRQTLGQWPTLFCRYYEGRRVHIVFLRFDISDVKGDLTDAVLNLFMNYSNRDRQLQVYGLADGPADLWDETTICYNSAPGLLPAELAEYALDTDQLAYLGTFTIIDNRIATLPVYVDSVKRCSWTPPTTLRQSIGLISNGRDYVDGNGMRQPLTLDGSLCGTQTNPSVFIHANAGITFDLDAIRYKYGAVSIESFKAACGISQLASNVDPIQTTAPSSASFYVLVDGREVFSAIDVLQTDASQKIDIQLNANAHYLTLVATQGTDNSIENDACVFVKPTLILK